MNARTLAIAMLVLTAACNKDEHAGEARTTSAPVYVEPLSGRDRAFITKEARGGMLEIQLGTEAAARAASPAVKSFGASMVNDHGKANTELMAIAKKKGVVLPTALDVDQEKTYRELTDLDGKKFDVAYAKSMVEDHEEDVKGLEEAIPNIDDPELKAWAERTLPVLKMHLSHAKEIDAASGKGARPKTMGP